MSSADLIPLASFVSVLVPGDSEAKISIKSFIQSKNLTFKKGLGFYELTKPELIQFDKKILVQRLAEPTTLVTGQTVKDILGIQDKSAGKYMVEEEILKEFRLFIQSTSYNRNLLGGTTFLYVKDGTDPFAAPAASTVGGTIRPATESGATPAAKRSRTGNAAGGNKIEIVFSFDTTGSMFPCLSTVRRVIRETLVKLTSSISSIRIGILAHGDYMHERTSYIIKAANDFKMCNATQLAQLEDFVKTVPATGGNDYPECYEYVLREVRNRFDWSEDANKAFVMIGDSPPHEPNDNPHRIDWRDEAKAMKDKGIRVYAVQALDYYDAEYFWKEVAETTNGFHLKLHQFSLITDFMMAVCYHEGDELEGGGNQLETFENELQSAGRMVHNLRQLFDKLQGRTPAAPAPPPTGASGELVPISPTRFQVLTVDNDQDIKGFAEERGLIFKVGRGFYEFTKPEAVSDKKEVVLMDKTTGDFYTGWAAAREFAGIQSGAGAKAKQKPKNNERYTVFIQSSSYNRKLMAGSKFLYEVDTSV